MTSLTARTVNDNCACLQVSLKQKYFLSFDYGFHEKMDPINNFFIVLSIPRDLKGKLYRAFVSSCLSWMQNIKQRKTKKMIGRLNSFIINDIDVDTSIMM